MNAKLNSLINFCRACQPGLRCDSRKVESGDIFIALPGSAANGAEFIPDAIARGAAHIVCAQDAAGEAAGCEIIAVEDPHAALIDLARARWRTDERPLNIIGVTGTNGKTTCAWLLERLFEAQGQTIALLGTIEYHWPGFRQQASLTTPGPLELHEMMANMAGAGVQTLIMEVSSHALAQNRIAGMNFTGAIFTNLTQDHLDFHKDMESYFRAKARLFMDPRLQAGAMAINGDDSHGRRLLELLPNAISFGLHKGMPNQDHLWGQILSHSPDGMRLRMSRGKQAWELDTGMIGAFNASNLLAVQALGLKMGLEPESFKILGHFPGAPGRLERVKNAKGYHIFIDYAHTPDALDNALRALRGVGFKRIITVFGCGGNRDRAKRPLMAKAVAENSDIAILTSDNPRLENPEAIMRDALPGLAKAKQVFSDSDRKSATAKALELMAPGDALLIAGKGHEDYQIIGSEKRHYSDKETVEELLACA